MRRPLPSFFWCVLLVAVLTPLACNRHKNGAGAATDDQPREFTTSGNVLVLEEPIQATGSALADARKLLAEKKYTEADAALKHAEQLNLRLEHYHLVLMGVRSHLSHALQVLRESHNEPATVQLDKAKKLIADHLAKNEPGAQAYLQDLSKQIDGIMADLAQDGKEVRANLKRLISMVDQAARRYAEGAGLPSLTIPADGK